VVADEPDQRVSGLPHLMGVLNVTPDSFSDGGRWLGAAAVERGLGLFEDGADWVDVGGESTRPGAPPVDVEEESNRVVPVIAELARRCPGRTLSVDTSKPRVAAAALDAGATVVNDVTGLADDEMARVVAAAGASLVVMHMRGLPATMQRDTTYDDLLGEVGRFLAERAARAVAAGVRADRVWIDPGVGFGKAPADNPRLIQAVPTFKALGWPVVIGASRKSFIGRLTGVEAADARVAGSIGAAIAAAEAGADVLRVHDVRDTRHALLVWAACRQRVRC
jgi:dihydropteroate synthase